LNSDITCTKDPTSNQPGEEKEADLIQAIGSEGGVITSENIQIHIPKNAFQKLIELKVYFNTENDFPDDAVTQSVEIVGLPQSFFKPIRISIKHNGDLSPDNLMALGSKNQNPLAEDTTMIYNMFETKDSSGYLVFNIPPRDFENFELSKHSKRVNTNDFSKDFERLCGVGNYHVSKDNHRFHFYYPKSVEPYIPQLDYMCDDCYYNILVSKLDFSFDDFSELWPINVVIRNSDEMKNQLIHAGLGFLGINKNPQHQNFYIDINKNSILTGQWDYLKKDLGKQLTNITLLLYGGLKRTIEEIDYLWMAEAVVNWSEEYYSDQGSFIAPRRFVNSEITPFNGFCSGARNQYYEVKRHGKGMSSVFKYLTNDPVYGIKGPSKTYELIKNGVEPPTALLNTTNRMVADWWPGFFHDFVNGDIYDVNASIFLDQTNIKRTWKIKDANDTQIIYSSSDLDNYDHLSAKLFSVELDYANIDATANLLIDADGIVNDDGIAVIVYGVKDNELHFLGETKNDNASVELENLRDYYDNNWRQFLIVVVNSMHSPPYIGKSEIDLTLSVREAPTQPVYKTCKVGLRCLRHYDREHSNGNTDNWDNDSHLTTSNFYEGSFEGNTFISSYEYSNNPPSYKKVGTITVNLNSTYDKIESFTWDEVYTLIHNEDFEEVISLSGENLPLDPNYYGAIGYFIDGAESVNQITHFTHERTSDAYDFSLQNWEGNDDSRIYIYFRE